MNVMTRLCCVILFFLCFSIYSAPTLISPANNSDSLSPEPLLTWNQSFCILEFSTDSTFPEANTTEKFVTSTERRLVGLLNNTKYYWRVKSLDRKQCSSVWNFKTRKAETTNGNGIGNTDVGIWYAPYDSPDFNPLDNAPYNPLCSSEQNDFCSDMNLSDPSAIDFHIEEIAKAKIDFIILENTNGGFVDTLTTNKNWDHYVNTSRTICQRIKHWNDNRNWKIRYVHAIGCYKNRDTACDTTKYMSRKTDGICINGTTDFRMAIEAQAEVCYNDFFMNPAYGDSSNWYYLDGKPLLIVFSPDYNDLMKKWYKYAQNNGRTSYTRKFTVRFASTGQKGMYGWPAWGGAISPGSFPSGTVIDEEVELVCPGYSEATHTYSIERNHGTFYRQNCWDRVLANPPRIVVIASFNDYWERTAVWPAKRRNSLCSSGYPECERWDDITGNENPRMYWNITKEYIRKLKHIYATPAIDLLLSD